MLGVGGKTSAGYGWFDVSSELQTRWQTKVAEAHHAEQRVRQQEQQERERKAQEEINRKAAEEHKQRLLSLSDDELEDYKLSLLTDEQFRGKLQNFAKHLSKEEQLAMIRALRADRLKFWDELKQRASRGGQWAHVEQAIRTLAKKANFGKMP